MGPFGCSHDCHLVPAGIRLLEHNSADGFLQRANRYKLIGPWTKGNYKEPLQMFESVDLFEVQSNSVIQRGQANVENKQKLMQRPQEQRVVNESE